MLGLDDIKLDVPDAAEEVARYCLPLIATQFAGQICGTDKKVLNFFISVFFFQYCRPLLFLLFLSFFYH